MMVPPLHGAFITVPRTDTLTSISNFPFSIDYPKENLMSTILETRGLTHVYGAGTPFERVALDHVDLKIEKGEILGVIGHTVRASLRSFST